ncbi:MAG: hypothetical protein ABIT20_26400 [Gemmatimonadaceae bacterium]
MMRTPAAILGTLFLIAGPVGAQQPGGVVSNPVASPVFPDIVAFERTASDRRELQFIRLSNEHVFPVSRPAGAGAARTPSPSSGQIDWRPVAEQGRSWFAYVANDERGSAALMLNYIDDAGELATTDPLRVPFAGQVRTPRWSRDGRQLAFVSDSSILYIVTGVASAVRAGTARFLQPTRVSAASRPALFPAWSPSGDQIAYGTEAISGGNRNGAIEVLPLNLATGEVVGVPVVVTGELSGDNEYRPSWSRDGKYIAFYADSTTAGSARPRVSIGIVEVVLSPRSGQTYRGIVKEGNQRWLVDDVIPDDMRGPAWTSVAEGSVRREAVMYVQRDAVRNDPIEIADVQHWLAQLPRTQFETLVTSASGAVSPRSVSSVEMNKKLRLVFASAKDGVRTVSYRDVAATWADGPDPRAVVIAAAPAPVLAPVLAPAAKANVALTVATHKGQDVGRALLFPGLGQFSAGRRGAGSVLFVAGAAGATVGIIGKLRMGAPLADGKAAAAAITSGQSSLAVLTANYNQAKSDYDAQRSKALLGAGVFAATWLYGIVDASIGSASGRDVSLKVAPDRGGDGRSRMNVGFSLVMGR